MKITKTNEIMAVITVTKKEQKFLKELYDAFVEMFQDIDDDYIFNESIVDSLEELAAFGATTEYVE